LIESRGMRANACKTSTRFGDECRLVAATMYQ